MADSTKTARDYFSESENKEIVDTIRKAELLSSGEIRVHLENRCRLISPLKRAARIFKRLKMHKTEQRSGVLIYLAVKDHKMAILADKGIYEQAPETVWDDAIHEMETAFKKGQFLEGLKVCIMTVGEQLTQYFPRTEEDQNELPDDISYGDT